MLLAALFLLLSLARCDAGGPGIILQNAVLLISGIFAVRQFGQISRLLWNPEVEPADRWNVRSLTAALLVLLVAIGTWTVLVVPAVLQAHLN